MTFRDVIGQDQGGVAWHEHDASEISGEAVFTDLTVDRLLSGTIRSKTIVIAGGTDGLLKSDNYSSGSAGWQIDGAGNAEFNDVVVRGTVASGGDLQSSNYSAGSAGWIIEGDGDAEFNDVTLRGTIKTAASGERIELGTTDASEMAFYTGEANEAGHGLIYVDAISTQGYLIMSSPDFSEGRASLQLISDSSAAPGNAVATITADSFSVDAEQITLLGTTRITVGDSDEGMRVKRTDAASRAAVALLDSSDNYLSEWRWDEGLRMNDGSASEPSLGFIDDTDTGMYRYGNNQVGITAGGVDQLITGNSSNPGIIVDPGSLTRPGIAFIGDGNTGFYQPSTDQIAAAIDGTQEMLLDATRIIFPNAYNATTGSAANVNVASGGQLARSTSSARYKTAIRAYTGESILSLVPSLFRSKIPADGDRDRLGLIAEDVAEHFPLAAIHDDEGRPDAIDWNAIVAGVLAELRAQGQAIRELRGQLAGVGA